MKNWARTPWLGVFIVIVGASLCAPQVAGALPGRTPVKAAVAVVNKNPMDFDTCHATFVVSGSVATVHTNGKCPEHYGLVSYSAASAGPFNTSWPQTLFATSADGITVALPTNVMTCFYQVDYIEQNPAQGTEAADGAALQTVDRTHRYGERIIAGMLGGAACNTGTTSTTGPGKTSSSVLGNQFGNSTTTEPVDAAVLGSSTQALPRTGASHVGLEALMGLGLMALGGSVLLADRRRRRLA